MKKIAIVILTVVLSLSGIKAETGIYSENHVEGGSGHFFYFLSERNPRDDYLKSIKATMLFYGTYEDHVEFTVSEYDEPMIDPLGRFLAVAFDDSLKMIALYTGGDLCSGMQFTKQESYDSAKGKILNTLKDAKKNCYGDLSSKDFFLVMFDKGFLKFD